MTNILEIKNLKKYFPVRHGLFARIKRYLKAVDDISFSIGSGKTLGLVGESGCGKTTAARTILQLTEPTGGEIIFNGKSVIGVSDKALRSIRSSMQIVFQDPYSSLNPRMTAGSIIREGLDIHKVGIKQQRRERVLSIMCEVGLNPEYENRYPHEFSGGQRQRIGIARALALNPKFIICDEPISALDVSIQAQIINMLQELQSQYNISYLFISHDLRVVRHICHEVCVMYLGKIVEQAPAEELFDNPAHPYTKALLSAVPNLEPQRKTERHILSGNVPSLINLPAGCYFHPRCRFVKEICKKEFPPLQHISDSHIILCHEAHKI
ncbi:MAG: dipeptide ABC transporter ATP-binding protein [Planctomycetota bacterium]